MANDLTEVKVGDLLMVNGRASNWRQVSVTKVGRRWITFGERWDRCDRETGAIDGDSSGSQRFAYTLEQFEARERRAALGERFAASGLGWNHGRPQVLRDDARFEAFLNDLLSVLEAHGLLSEVAARV